MSDIRIIKVDDVTIAVTPVINVTGRRRDAERDAVGRLVTEVAGAGAGVMHRGDGAPYIPGGPHISITHCRDIAAVAVCRSFPAGIDAEQWRPALRRVAPKFLSDAEMDVFKSDVDLLRAWTVKEAVFKIAGGAALDFRNNIAIASDFASASALGNEYALRTFTISGATITVAF